MYISDRVASILHREIPTRLVDNPVKSSLLEVAYELGIDGLVIRDVLEQEGA